MTIKFIMIGHFREMLKTYPPSVQQNSTIQQESIISECRLLIEKEFPDDSEDEEYHPGKLLDYEDDDDTEINKSLETENDADNSENKTIFGSNDKVKINYNLFLNYVYSV